MLCNTAKVIIIIIIIIIITIIIVLLHLILCDWKWRVRKHPEIFKCRLYAMIFVNTDRHLLISFDISNLNQCPIHHSACLQFNVTLLFMYTKYSAKCYGKLCSVEIILIFAIIRTVGLVSPNIRMYVLVRDICVCEEHDLWFQLKVLSSCI
jgi:hypothetical protein